MAINPKVIVTYAQSLRAGATKLREAAEAGDGVYLEPDQVKSVYIALQAMSDSRKLDRARRRGKT